LKAITFLFVFFITLTLSACDDKSKFDGVYICIVSDGLNRYSMNHGAEHFPLGTTTARVSFHDGKFTIYGMSSGDYTSMSLNDASDDDKLNLNHDENLQAKDAMIKRHDDRVDTFSPSGKTFGITNKSKGLVQQFSNCERT